mmetsp:Transcript_8883/g.26687  ORF Transcript_8883/g.26687 Transcript_8883/m.26687 type:complete len:188 (+) Transcript_8883:160-723(+)
MRVLTAFVAIAAVAALAPTHKLSRRDAAFAGAAAAAAALAPGPALADVKVDASAIKTTLGGVKYVVTKPGSCPEADALGVLGSCAPKMGSFCIIDFTGFLPDGQVFDSTEKKGGKPLAFKLGEKQVIVGIEQVVSQMTPGEEVQALIPAALAYGEKGVCTEAGECLIKPNTNLKYFIRLNRVATAAG